MHSLYRYTVIRFHRKYMVLALGIIFLVTLTLIILLMPTMPVQKAILTGNTLTAARGVMQYYSEGDYLPSRPILVLFTTFSVTEKNAHIYKNTLRNWGLLQPAVQPVLFHDDMNPEWLLLAQGWGWTRLPVPEKLEKKLPFLKAMYMEVFREFQADFYAFANGDILFDESLVLTLWTLQQNRTRNVFLIGRRTNYPVSSSMHFHDLNQVRTAANETKAKLFINDAQDYFISTQSSFPWEKIPNFVIGRVGYDNWLVQHALRRHLKVIDTTNSILALHQTGVGGNFAGYYHKEHQAYNTELVGDGFDYSLGKTDCALWETNLDHLKGGVQLKLRIPNPCMKYFSRLGVEMFTEI